MLSCAARWTAHGELVVGSCRLVVGSWVGGERLAAKWAAHGELWCLAGVRGG